MKPIKNSLEVLDTVVLSQWEFSGRQVWKSIELGEPQDRIQKRSLQQGQILNRLFESRFKVRLLQVYGEDVMRRGKHTLSTGTRTNYFPHLKKKL